VLAAVRGVGQPAILPVPFRRRPQRCLQRFHLWVLALLDPWMDRVRGIPARD
jgi:hypothetical protein